MSKADRVRFQKPESDGASKTNAQLASDMRLRLNQVTATPDRGSATLFPKSPKSNSAMHSKGVGKETKKMLGDQVNDSLSHEGKV